MTAPGVTRASAIVAPILALVAVIAHDRTVGSDDEAEAKMIALSEALHALADSAVIAREAQENIPTSHGAAIVMLLQAQQAHEAALLAVAEAANAVLLLEDEQGRLRRVCGRQIQTEHIEASGVGAKALSDTALDKLAGDHPEYVAHRQRLAQRQIDKNDADAHAKIIAERVATARMLCEYRFRMSGALDEAFAQIHDDAGLLALL